VSTIYCELRVTDLVTVRGECEFIDQVLAADVAFCVPIRIAVWRQTLIRLLLPLLLLTRPTRLLLGLAKSLHSRSCCRYHAIPQ